jgi:hypothetical protein
MHSSSTLLHVHKFMMLPLHNTRWNVLSTEIIMKLYPLHLMVSGMSGGKVSPPCPSGSYQLLWCKESLLMFSTTKEPKLGLSSAQPIICLQWFTRFSESWRVSGQEFPISAFSVTMKMANTMSTTGRVIHEPPQQVSMFIPCLQY